MNRIVFGAIGLAAFLLAEISSAAPPVAKRPMPKGGPNGGDVDYEFNVLADAKVRLMNLPVEFDEKGRPKKYEGDELKKRKGDDAAEQKLPGFKSEFNVLKPGDVVQVTFSRPKNPKDLENTTWNAITGNMTGIITNVDNGKDEKVLTVRVSPNGPPQAGGDKGPRGRMPRGDAPKNSIKPDQRQASLIVIVDQAPEPENKGGKGAFRKKKKE